MTSLQHIRFSGLGFVSTTEKRLDTSTTYDRFFPKPDWKERIVRRDGKVEDVVGDMVGVIFKYREDTRRFAPFMRGANIYETCRNLWNFWYHRCRYKEDVKGREQLRRAARSYWEGAGFGPDKEDFGIDCDDFSMAVAQCLVNLGIPCYLRIARYPLVDHFQHVYVVVPYRGKQITVDCVLDQFDLEKPTAEHKDYIVMDKSNLNGIDIAVLSGLGAAPLLDVVTGSDFLNLKGFGAVTDKDKELDAVYQHLIKTRQLVVENPELVKEAEHPETFVQMLDYAIKYFNTDKRDEALAVLADEEEKANSLRGFTSEADNVEVEFRGLSGGGFAALGKVTGKHKFFDKVKDAAKKAGEGIKEAGKAVVRYNPISVAARAGLLLALKTNLFHMAEALKWGYLTPQQAKDQGFDEGEWAKLKAAHRDTENMFVTVLQGEKEHLKDAIVNGRAGGLSGITLGELGIEPVTTATTTAAATGFIAKIKSLLGKINLKKLLAKVDPSKLLKKGDDKTPTMLNPAPGNSNTTSNTNTLPAETPDTPPGDGSNQRNANDEGSGFVKVLPVLAIGALAVYALTAGKKKKPQVSGLSGTGKKSKKKKSKGAHEHFEVYGVPALTGSSYVRDPHPGSTHKRKRRKPKGGKKHKGVKKYKLG